MTDSVPPGDLFHAFARMVGAYTRARKLQRELPKQGRGVHEFDLRGPHGEMPYLPFPDNSLPAAEVLLDNGAMIPLAQGRRQIAVSLIYNERDSGAVVEVYIGPSRVGILGDQEGQIFIPVLDAAGRSGKVLMMPAVVEKSEDSTVRVRILAMRV